LRHQKRFIECIDDPEENWKLSEADIAEHFGVHYMTVSRAVKRFEEGKSEKSQSRKFDVKMLECET
jgi:transposase